VLTEVLTADLGYAYFSPLYEQSDQAVRYTDVSAPADPLGLVDSLPDPPSAKKGR
jgi:hypothetical protein